MHARCLAFICCAILTVSLAGAPWAGEPPYKYDKTQRLVALVEEAAKLVETNGEKAFTQFRKKGSKWFKGDLYLFVDDDKGNCLVNTGFPAQEGASLMEFRDIAGRPVMKTFIDSVYGPNGQRTSWVHYIYPRPGRAKPAWKASYIVRAKSPSGKRYIVGAGLYKMKMEPRIIMHAVKRACRLIEKFGPAAFTELRSPDSQFVFADTYVFVQSDKGVELINPAFPDLEGRNLFDLKDTKGLFITRELIALVKAKGQGWLEYQWPKPGQNKASQKRTFVKGAKHKGKLFIVGCGYYPN